MKENAGRSPTYTRHFWAKSDRTKPGRIHLLEHHLADVGAVFEALLRQPTIKRRLARCGGLEDLDDVTVARLSVLAALHDIGKVNLNFQTQVWQLSEIPSRLQNRGQAGHTAILSPVLSGEDDETSEWFFDALGWWDHMINWDDEDGKTVAGLFVATLSHHGRPFQCPHPDYARNTSIWKPIPGLHPQRQVERIGRLLRLWFPKAFEADSAPLPAAPEFQHHFLGLCTLADWIGSNQDWFSFVDESRDDYIESARDSARQAVEAVGLDLDQQRGRFDGVPDFSELFGIEEPANAIQRQTVFNTSQDEQIVIVESETGSGKTEAALWRFAKMYEAGLVDGLYFALPTRAAAVQIHDRVRRFVERMFRGGYGPKPVLAIPGYVRPEDFSTSHLPEYDLWWDGAHSHSGSAHNWAAENPKRFLTVQIAVGTVDQAMMGALKVNHAHLRSSSLARNLLVVDEVHASDTYMSRILSAVLDAHIGSGGYALLMSATLGSVARKRWIGVEREGTDSRLSLDQAITAPYPAVSTASGGRQMLSATGENNQRKTVTLVASRTMPEFGEVAKRALGAARTGAKVLVVRNTVDYAVKTQLAIEALAGDSDDRLLFRLPHARGDRPWNPIRIQAPHPGAPRQRG